MHVRSRAGRKVTDDGIHVDTGRGCNTTVNHLSIHLLGVYSRGEELNERVSQMTQLNDTLSGNTLRSNKTQSLVHNVSSKTILGLDIGVGDGLIQILLVDLGVLFDIHCDRLCMYISIRSDSMCVGVGWEGDGRKSELLSNRLGKVGRKREREERKTKR